MRIYIEEAEHHVGKEVEIAGWLYLEVTDPEEDVIALHAWDISDPENPEVVWQDEIPSYVGHPKISGDLLYTLIWQNSLSLWDISDRSEPQFLNEIEAQNVYNTHIDNDRLYFLNRDNLEVIDISDPEEPEMIGQFELEFERPFSIYAEGDCAYVASYTGFYVLDVSNPDDISIVIYTGTKHIVNDIVKSDSLLYICNDSYGLRVFDLQSRDEPFEAGYIDTPGHAMRCVVENSIVYICDYFDLTICRYDPDTFVRYGETASSAGYRLWSACPNPFNISARIDYSLPYPSWVRVALFDIRGRTVYRGYNEHREIGTYSFVWDGSDKPSGVYILQLTSGKAGSGMPVFTGETTLHLIK